MKKTIQIIIATVFFACNAHASDSENIACKSAKPGFLKSIINNKSFRNFKTNFSCIKKLVWLHLSFIGIDWIIYPSNVFKNNYS